MEGVVASSRQGALDRVSAKCSKEPFLYTTVKLYCCRKSIIFCKHVGAEARSFRKMDWSGWWSVWRVMSDFPRRHWSNLLQCNELNQGHPTFFYQSQDEFRTKESEFVHIGQITNEGLAVKRSSTKRQLNIYWNAPRKTLGGPGRVRYTSTVSVL